MTLLNTADKVYLGALAADAVYAGPTKVWPAPPTGPTAHLMTSFSPATDRNDFTGEVGVRLNMTANRAISFIGMRCGTGNTGIKTVKIYEWFADALVATASIDMTGKTVGTFVWAPIAPVTLLVGYYGLLASTVQGDGQWWSENAPTAFDPTYTGNIYATYRSPGGAMAVTGADMQFVGVDVGW